MIELIDPAKIDGSFWLLLGLIGVLVVMTWLNWRDAGKADKRAVERSLQQAERDSSQVGGKH